METTKSQISGKVRIQIYDESQNLKYSSENHNIVTAEGDAYIADLLSPTPTRTKITSGVGYIPVGTGWTGTNTKQNTWVNTQVGNAQVLDPSFPKTKGAWGASDDNVLQYQVTYPQGSLNVTGLNEAALTSHATNVSDNSTLAYAQITPAATVTATDVLIISWEITFEGK